MIEKKPGKGWIAACVLLYMIGIGCLMSAMLKEILGIPSWGQIILVVASVVAVILAMLVIIGYFRRLSHSSREWHIEEEDERNQFIRGKAAEDVNLVHTIGSLVLVVVLCYRKEWVGVSIICLLGIIETMTHFLRFGYYDKKY